MRRELAKFGLTPASPIGEDTAMRESPDNVIMTVPQIVEHFGVGIGAVRLWIAAGLIQPVQRAGRGGSMYFRRADVGALVFGLCPVCFERFKKARIAQTYCSQKCRQKANRALHAADK